MKISNIIKELQKVMDSEGDLPVYFEHDWEVKIKDVDLRPEWQGESKTDNYPKRVTLM